MRRKWNVLTALLQPTVHYSNNQIRTQPISWARNFLNFRRSYNQSQLNRAWKWKLIIRTSTLDTLPFLNRMALLNKYSNDALISCIIFFSQFLCLFSTLMKKWQNR